MRLYLYLLIATIIIMSHEIAMASEWKYITSDDTRAYYYDTSSIDKISNFSLSVSIKEVLLDHHQAGIKAIVLVQEINCYHSLYRNKKITTYYDDKNSTIFEVNLGDTEWYDIEFNTVGYDIVTQICSESKTVKSYLEKNRK